MAAGEKGSLEELVAAAQQHLQRNELAEAEVISQRILKARPNHIEGLLLAALVAAMRENPARAEHLLGRVLQRDPRSVQALCMLGRLQRDTSNPRKAVSCLMRGLQTEFGLGYQDSPIDFWRTLIDGVERAASPLVWRHRVTEFQVLGWGLQASGQFAQHAPAVFARLAAVDVGAMPAPEAAERVSALLDLAGFAKSSPPDWNRALFEQVALPWMQQSLAIGQHDAAILVERAVLSEYVAQNETEAHFAATVCRWVDDMRAAGRRFGQQLPPLTPREPGQVPRVAFFVHMLTGLAHVRLLLDMLEGHAALAEPLFRPFIFGLRSSWDEATARRVAALGIDLNIADFGPRDARADELAGLRAALEAREIDAVVWVSYVHLMPFAFAMRVARVQIWWAMKYHSLEFPEIDGYLTGGGAAGGTRRIGPRLWRAGPVAAENWFDPELSAEAARLRSRYASHSILYGCFGREEKLNSALFLDAVVEVLKAVPEAGFLWTGREKTPQIQAALEQGGVAERCHYIGWVNTRLYAQVIDVFLDSFPFPCGYTLYESLAAARPAVLYASAEAAETGARSMIEPLLSATAGAPDREAAQSIFKAANGESLYLCAADPAQYIAYAVRLGRDPGFRNQAGKAAAEFTRRFMSDRARLGRIYGEHIAAIVREAAAA